MEKNGIKSYSNENEQSGISQLADGLFNTPIPKNQILDNLGLFLTQKNLSRILFFNYIYSKVLEVQGQIFDFGTRWGNNLAVLTSLRGIYEPFNRHRTIVGFDTFDGFPEITKEDGNSDLMVPGNLETATDYDNTLRSIIQCHENMGTLNHIQKTKVVKGDACDKLAEYLFYNQHTIVAFAYFDFDVYKPTKECINLIKKRITKGSVIAFDELNDPDSPGETLALMDTFGLNNVTLKRWPNVSRISYFVFGE